MMKKSWRVSDFPVREDLLGPLGIVDGHGQCLDDALIPGTAMCLSMGLMRNWGYQIFRQRLRYCSQFERTQSISEAP